MIKLTTVYDEELLTTQSNGIPPPFSYRCITDLILSDARFLNH
jgi:hypothetical protein